MERRLPPDAVLLAIAVTAVIALLVLVLGLHQLLAGGDGALIGAIPEGAVSPLPR